MNFPDSKDILHKFPEAPSYDKTSNDIINDDEVSIFRFFTQAEIDDVRNRTFQIDVSPKITYALSQENHLYFPSGLYRFDHMSFEQTNGGNRSLRGEAFDYFSGHKTVFKASTLLTNSTPLWLGNNTGHGIYAPHISNILFHGGAKSQNNSGIVLQECALGHLSNVAFYGCGQAATLPGIISFIIDGMNAVFECTEGIYAYRIPAGTPSGSFDRSVTSAPIATSTNINKISGIWFSGVDRNLLWLEGGQCDVSFITSQNCGTDENYDLITFKDCNESFDYGGGGVIHHTWFEGGKYRYAIASRHTRALTVRENWISGADAPSDPNVREGAILFSESPNYDCHSNSIRGYFNGTPTQSRLASAAIYVTANSYPHKSKGMGLNYLTTNTCNYYFEGLVQPTIQRAQTPYYAVITFSGGVATIQNENGKFINSITRNAVGKWTVIYTFNKDNNYAPVICIPQTASTITYSTSQSNAHAANGDEFYFRDNTGALADPDGINLFLYCGYVGV